MNNEIAMTVDLAAGDTAAIADALELLAGIDEGEHTDRDQLLGMAGRMRAARRVLRGDPDCWVDDVQVVDLDALAGEVEHWRGRITVTVTTEHDSMGLPRVLIEATSEDTLVEFVRDNWGDDDSDWWQVHILDRIHQL